MSIQKIWDTWKPVVAIVTIVLGAMFWIQKQIQSAVLDTSETLSQITDEKLKAIDSKLGSIVALYESVDRRLISIEEHLRGPVSPTATDVAGPMPVGGSDDLPLRSAATAEPEPLRLAQAR